MGGTVVPVPNAKYDPIYLPDGTHSGVRVDRERGIIEVQRKGIKYYFDLAVSFYAVHNLPHDTKNGNL